MTRRIANSFDTLAHAWLGSFTSENTKAAYGRDLELFAAWLATTRREAPTATAADIAAFRRHCEASGAGPATVNRRLAAISSFYRFAADRWSIANPSVGVDRPVVAGRPPVRGLDPAQADAVWHAADELGPKTAVLVGLVLLDGLRMPEVLSLDADHLRFTKQSVVAELAGRPGPGVRLDPRTAAAVRALLGRRRHGPLLEGDVPGRAPERLTRFGVDYLVKRAGRQAGLAHPLTVSVLRATHAATPAR